MSSSLFVRGAIPYVMICRPIICTLPAFVHFVSRLVPRQPLLLATLLRISVVRKKKQFFGFINMYSLGFCLVSSGVGALSLQPSESPLKSFGFLKIFLDLSSPHLLDSVFLEANASSVLFIIPQVFTQVMASGATLVCAFDSLGTLVELEAPPFLLFLPSLIH